MSRRRMRRALATALTVLAAGTALVGALFPGGGAGAGSAANTSLPSLASPLLTVSGAPPVSGRIRAPGGPYLYDREGRIVFFHGVNAVYKLPPYELYPDRGKPWNLSAADASLMAQLGFNVVRLGMTWRGLEPGTAPANDPAICRRGTPQNPDQFNRAVFNRYVGRLEATVDLLGRYHIYTILDMHQDVYNEMFDGEGEPNWAVCTDGVPSVNPPGRWSREYGTRAAGIAFHHFWTNDVVGDLQGEYDRVWGMVAHAFRNNPWVLGYDPFNEPFSTALVTFHNEHFDAQLECFYTGTAHVGAPANGAPPITCPVDDPANGVVPTILANDPNHLIFDEPDNYTDRGYPTFLGPMDLPNLVFNVHIYCGARSPVTGNPTNVRVCADQEVRSLDRREDDRAAMASSAQPAGPAWFVSEFGATSDPTLLSRVTAEMDAEQVGWAFWAWKYYDD
ncbi:MAG TPA: cellulase family glycosylhydrolase, partial [Acidimicrobiales bacterium]|nr:cellulase family glycosylhydrolase [Acidimicrobiales bacterium]